MNTIINAVFAEIAHCSHLDPQQASLRACIDSKVESLALTGMEMVQQNPHAVQQNKDAIRKLVRESIEDCTHSLEEIGYDTSGWNRSQQCIIERGNRLVDMAVDMMSEGIVPDEETLYEGTRKKRCSRRKSSSLKSILRKSSSRKRKSLKKVRIQVWK
jgi:hypothetical protein